MMPASELDSWPLPAEQGKSMRPHDGQAMLLRGAKPESAERGVILLHGRGAAAESMFDLAAALDLSSTAWLAPQAADFSWYPHPFLRPTIQNQPWLDSALERVSECIERLETAGLRSEQLSLVGFSQGACLALEYAVRHGGRIGSAIGLSGGLIGSDAEVEATAAAGKRLEGLQVFMGCSDADPHIPAARFERSAAILEQKGANVTARLYRGLGHTVNADELRAVKELLSRRQSES